ncbi:Tim44p [Sugiyamaella lignohabitans]|uniref:Mitochondrial import inner membrane translocase subunit TIM44 n=1 Tax=Sugiyamaella lignohabitans TaxID=796027 RepID=A0A167EIG8_9ASCO|nr:Tim44p [Sugiyamaella lignohabitans]ANB14123.1 Tim44p [Sugiyamaella lignohabitans]
MLSNKSARSLAVISRASLMSRASGRAIGNTNQMMRMAGSTGFHSSRASRADPPSDKSPFQVFVDTFKNEWSKSKELQNDIKALQDETGRMSESGAYKKAKEALDKAKSGTSAASSVTGRSLKKAGQVVGSAAATAWDSPIVKTTRTAVNKTAESVDKATEPIRKTKMYKNLKDVIDDGSSMRYGGFEEKEARRLRRELEEKKRLEEELRTGVKRYVKANPEAGDSVVVHETAKPDGKSWKDDFEKTSVGKKAADLKMMYEESENGFVSTIRSIGDTIGSFFAETESGKVVRLFKQMDPSFSQDEFLKDVRQYILPEVLDAYVKGDKETLGIWLSEAPLNIWAASAKQYQEQGLYSAGRVLDIRGVDILSAKLLQPADIPVYVIGCRAQEVHLYKNIKTDEIAAGVEDAIQLTTYAMVMTRIPEDMDNPETKGWKLLELVRGQSRQWT